MVAVGFNVDWGAIRFRRTLPGNLLTCSLKTNNIFTGVVLTNDGDSFRWNLPKSSNFSISSLYTMPNTL